MTDVPPAPGPAEGAGRRDNGLTAEHWTLLAEVDPRVAQDALDRLRGGGVAAYCVPVSAVDPVTYAARPPRLHDRVYVDASLLERARGLLADTLPTDPPLDEQAAWAQIVASLTAPDPVVRTWPDAEDLPAGPSGGGLRPATAPPAPPPPGRVQPGRAPSGLPRRRIGDRPAPPATAGPPTPTAEDEADEHFSPPPPPPLPGWTLATALAVAAVLGGILLLVLPAALGEGQTGYTVLGVAGILGGAGTLIARVRPGPSGGAGPDDGAVV